MTRSTDLAVGMVVAAFGAAIIFASQDFEPLLGLRYGPSLFPTIIGIGIAVCGLIMAVRPWLGFGGGDAGDPGEVAAAQPPGARGRIAALAWVLAGTTASIWLLKPLGFIVCCGVVMAGMLILLRVRPVSAIVFSAVLATGAHLVFVHALHVPIPAGIFSSF